jgi:hypothetical protein
LVGEEATKIGQSKAFQNKWIGKEGAGFVRAVSSATFSTCGVVQSELLANNVGERRSPQAIVLVWPWRIRG